MARLDGAPTAAKIGIPARDSLLDELKTRASAHEENSVLERDTAIEPLGAKQLVDRVMPSDILS